MPTTMLKKKEIMPVTTLKIVQKPPIVLLLGLFLDHKSITAIYKAVYKVVKSISFVYITHAELNTLMNSWFGITEPQSPNTSSHRNGKI